MDDMMEMVSTDHAELDKVIDSLLAEQALASDPRPALGAKAPKDHWLRRMMTTGPVELPQLRR